MGGVSGPGGVDPSKGKPTNQGDMPKQVQTGLEKSYTAKKAPGFAKWLNLWFPGGVTPEMVSAFERNVMTMISASLKRSKAQHKRIEEEIKRRINKG
ncbi:hypothetical protein [Candidatus Neptunochlamydia vexilliferae]|uniref:Uncharacterized protein n=1 Tax=Candidatus Neptunichlamydia vexilliferae TaxID=1651774 RepID=A0ABS0AYZ7_9BACT|nr:hypothetical protein [Candidatus Neptunochlamydia vexilliferae]MBF5059344.1 hypothetical protein [Candidatus Neptunochlamydia vexilliferae]